ncbi:MAG TPA: hypothetical protein VKA94_00860 [Hyphomicrobiales bacterium]|nr:hypothetical protein [Hyphomicrobiales bacterium]
MADSDDNTGGAGGNTTLREQLKFSVIEARIGVEAIMHGLEAVARRPESAPVREELKVLEKLAGQAATLLDTVKDTLAGPDAEPSL